MSYRHIASGRVFTTISDVRQHSAFHSVPLPALPTADEFFTAGYEEFDEPVPVAPATEHAVGVLYPPPTPHRGLIPVVVL